MIRASVRLWGGDRSEFAGEVCATIGVDIQASRLASGRELARVDYGSNDDKTLSFIVALDFLRLSKPSVVCGGESVGIFHDVENSSVVLAEIPRDADGPGLRWDHLAILS